MQSRRWSISRILHSGQTPLLKMSSSEYSHAYHCRLRKQTKDIRNCRSTFFYLSLVSLPPNNTGKHHELLNSTPHITPSAHSPRLPSTPRLTPKNTHPIRLPRYHNPPTRTRINPRIPFHRLSTRCRHVNPPRRTNSSPFTDFPHRLFNEPVAQSRVFWVWVWGWRRSECW
jgi:hypothetical protein